MRLEWTKRARTSLFSETEYIRKENPVIAADVITNIKKSTDYLLANPEMGRISRFHGTRELVISKYPFIVWYRVGKHLLEILRVKHTAKNY